MSNSPHTPVITTFDEEIIDAILESAQTPYGERPFKTREIAEKVDRPSTALSPVMYSLERLGAVECVNRANAACLWRANVEVLDGGETDV